MSVETVECGAWCEPSSSLKLDDKHVTHNSRLGGCGGRPCQPASFLFERFVGFLFAGNALLNAFEWHVSHGTVERGMK